MSAVHTVGNREDDVLLAGYDNEIATIMQGFPASIQVTFYYQVRTLTVTSLIDRVLLCIKLLETVNLALSTLPKWTLAMV